ncbi:MAG TPA: hypothetical protein VEK39_14915 [Solirubrobacterales bacterium]|nr:hypothetical protein [Solirubrobacterales bacterium]
MAWTRPGAVAGTAVALIASTVVGCGGSGSPPQGGVGGPIAAPINLADCTDWEQASVEERLGTIEQLRNFVGGEVAGSGGRGVVLDDEDAYQLFENTCANEYARGFKLYKLYSRAAAFSGEAGQ